MDGIEQRNARHVSNIMRVDEAYAAIAGSAAPGPMGTARDGARRSRSRPELARARFDRDRLRKRRVVCIAFFGTTVISGGVRGDQRCVQAEAVR